MRQSVGTVEQMWIDPNNLNFESDGQISDISEIWSQYGDEIEPHTEGKLHKWNPNRKNVSTKLSNEERGLTTEHSNKRRYFNPTRLAITTLFLGLFLKRYLDAQ